VIRLRRFFVAGATERLDAIVSMVQNVHVASETSDGHILREVLLAIPGGRPPLPMRCAEVDEFRTLVG